MGLSFGVTVNNELEKRWYEMIVDLFEVLCQSPPGDTGEKHGKS
jgi:hypothetical protein